MKVLPILLTIAASIILLTTQSGIGAGQSTAKPPPASAATQPTSRPAFDLATYAGKPFADAPAAIPGKITFAYYDRGEEGVSSHDLDKANHGSGELNRGPEERDHFREKERVDISYTKAAFDKFADGTKLPVNDYYVGWTNAGEWLNYTVDVKEAGTYTVNALVSSNNKNAAVRLSVDGVDRTGPITIPSTGHWHTWQKMEPLVAELALEKGRHVITFEIVREGNMNLGTMEFVARPAAGEKGR